MIINDDVRAVVARSRAAQGLPPTIEDPETLATFARIMYGGDWTPEDFGEVDDSECEGPWTPDVHTYFGLTYANYLVLNRTLMQSMPEEWQHRMVKCLSELDDAFAHIDRADLFEVRVRDNDGKYTKDPVPPYNRGREYIEPRLPEHEGAS